MTTSTDKRRSVSRSLSLRARMPAAAQSAAVDGSAAAGAASLSGSITFDSILFLRAADRDASQRCAVPECFADLNLDQVVDAVIMGREPYDLKAFYYTALQDTDAIQYRHEIFRDLESATFSECIRSFTNRMREVRDFVAQGNKLYYTLQKEAWLLDTIELYGDAIRKLASDLAQAPLSSRGFRGFRAYLAQYVAGVSFTSLMDETDTLRHNLAQVHYSILIRDNAFSVDRYAGEQDYSTQILKTFDKFKQGATNDYRAKFRVIAEMNHIEAKVAEFVAELHPDLFASLRGYRARHVDFIDTTISVFDREVQFYLAYSDHLNMVQTDTLRFCYPHIAYSKQIYVQDGFDLALANKLAGGGATVVCNDLFLDGDERVIVVSGPNQGGKTTFARMFGQLHHLASLGCPVPARDARLFLFDHIFTHFERAEKVENLKGKLEDDLRRVRSILDQTSPSSIIILNEVFTSTTLQDETFLSRKVLEEVIERDLLCVWVTFVDELASFDRHTISMVSTIVPENPALRTFKVVRKPADGLAYAMAIAENHHLSYARIKERLHS